MQFIVTSDKDRTSLTKYNMGQNRLSLRKPSILFSIKIELDSKKKV